MLASSRDTCARLTHPYNLFAGKELGCDVILFTALYIPAFDHSKKALRSLRRDKPFKTFRAPRPVWRRHLSLNDKTIYPQCSPKVTPDELALDFTPTEEEPEFTTKSARPPASRLTILVVLKFFQKIHRFQNPDEVAVEVIDHIRTQLRFGTGAQFKTMTRSSAPASGRESAIAPFWRPCSITAFAAKNSAGCASKDIQSRQAVVYLRVKGKRDKVRFLNWINH
jgi:hypothetical protein